MVAAETMLVVGADGMIGRALAERLVKGGHDVVCTVRTHGDRRPEQAPRSSGDWPSSKQLSELRGAVPAYACWNWTWLVTQPIGGRRPQTLLFSAPRSRRKRSAVRSRKLHGRSTSLARLHLPSGSCNKARTLFFPPRTLCCPAKSLIKRPMSLTLRNQSTRGKKSRLNSDCGSFQEPASCGLRKSWTAATGCWVTGANRSSAAERSIRSRTCRLRR